ncbi:MAG TPA: alpha/beta fold hydrolase [Methylibium sp.]
MLAALQRRTTISLLLAAAIWAWVFAQTSHPYWALGGALLIVFNYALVLGCEFLISAFLNRTEPVPRASFAQQLRAWLREVQTAPRVFCWRQPFHEHAVPDQPQGRSGQRGIVFIHGFVCNRALWTPWMKRLRALGQPYVAVSLEPVFGSIDDYVPQIEAAVRRIEAGTGAPPVLVCHSMGGLAARAWLGANAAAGGGDARVTRVITIGTPHHGTWLARWGRTTNTKQMRRLDRGNAWLQALAASEPASRYARFSCFYGHCDNIVFPASTALLPGAEAHHLSGVSHVHMAFHEEIFREALRWLGREESSGADADAAARKGAAAEEGHPYRTLAD